MNKRSLKLYSFLLSLLMVLPLVLMACNNDPLTSTADSTSESTTSGTDGTTDVETTLTTDSTTETEDDTQTSDEVTEPVLNQNYVEWEEWEKAATQINVGSTIISGLKTKYPNDEVKYYINDTYDSDASAFSEVDSSEIAGTSKHFAVWEESVGSTPTDPSEKRVISVYLSRITFDFATEYEQYTTPRGKDFIVNFKSATPYTVYAAISDSKTAALKIIDNTPFVATQLSGKNGEVKGKLKIKYADYEPGTYYVNYYIRTLGSVLTQVASVPLTITENKNYTPNQFKVYVLNVDGYSSITTVDRAESRFYQIYPTIYYAYTEIPNQNKGRIRTCYIRITKGTSNDPKVGGQDLIAFISNPEDTMYWDADWASRIDDVDCIVHEFTHVLQNRWTSLPSFFTEGVAEYSRYVYGGDIRSTWSPPNDKTNEFEAYNAGGFFVYICKTYNSYLAEKTKGQKTDIMSEIFRFGKSGTWRETSGIIPSSWVELTGKEFDVLAAEYRASNFTMPTDYKNPNGQYVEFIKDLRVIVPEGYVFQN